MYRIEGKRVLVTGGTGFLGSCLVRLLIERGAYVHVLIRARSDRWRLREIEPQLVVHSGDLADFDSLRHVVAVVQPEVIFHTAASGGYPGQGRRESVFANNVLAAHHLLLATRDLACRRIVHTGGSLEYGPKTQPIVENDVLEPLSVYGAAKAAATILLQQAARHEKRPIVIVRAFSIYGCREAPSRFIPTAIRAALLGTRLPLTAPGFVRDFIFVDDVAEACVRAAEADGVQGEIINIGTGVQSSNEEVVAHIEQQVGRPIDVDVGAYPPHLTDTTHWAACVDKAKTLLDWQARYTLAQGLAKTIAWFKESIDKEE